MFIVWCCGRAGGDRRGAGIEKSGAFEGAEGQSLGTGAGEIFFFFFSPTPPPLHPRRQRSTKSRQEESSKLGASPEWMLSFVLLLSATFVWSSPKLDVVLTRLRCLSTSFPLPAVAGSGGLGVLLTRSQKFVLPRDRYLGPLCWAVISAEALTRPPAPPPRSQLDFRGRERKRFSWLRACVVLLSAVTQKPHSLPPPAVNF